jgi:hypothetical protein
VATTPVTEVFQGKIVWDGEVETFSLIGHPHALQCFAWAYKDDDGTNQITTVLALPPVQTPQDAVKAALVAKVKNENKET